MSRFSVVVLGLDVVAEVYRKSRLSHHAISGSARVWRAVAIHLNAHGVGADGGDLVLNRDLFVAKQMFLEAVQRQGRQSRRFRIPHLTQWTPIAATGGAFIHPLHIFDRPPGIQRQHSDFPSESGDSRLRLSS